MLDTTLSDLAQQILAGKQLSHAEALELLDPKIELLNLVDAAYQLRKHYFDKKVRIHILNNAKNGKCPEDCNYCAQGQKADPDMIEDYPMKSDEEIMAEAKRAAEAGAFRYCMVFAGRGPSDKRVERLANLVQEIKATYPLEVCVSPGLLKAGQAKTLKEAGLDRLNHNLNTTEENYGKICSTHTYEDRLNTLKEAQTNNLSVCSGLILGMGEGPEGAVEILHTLQQLKAESIPVNFLVPVPGVKMTVKEKLTPEYCLRILCVARLLNPSAEIRAAGGRELHLRGLQSLALYPANSIFMDGYLNIMGTQQIETLKMILDAGFEIESELDLPEDLQESYNDVTMKGREDLKPACS
jgi:biotin synthase